MASNPSGVSVTVGSGPVTSGGLVAGERSGAGGDQGGGGGSGGVANSGGGYSLHQLQGNKQLGCTRSGFLLKKSEGKVRKVWQKRRCDVRGDGFLSIYHADETKPPTRVNLLTCQIKPLPEDRRCFDLISCNYSVPLFPSAHGRRMMTNLITYTFIVDNRTYHFQADEEDELSAWMSVLVNSKEGALMKAFDDNGRHGPKVNQGFIELQQAIIRYILRLPGNDRCADCCSQNGKCSCSILQTPTPPTFVFRE